jgi:beta-galactosidase GanA
VLATFSSDFHSGAPAMTLRTEADGGAAYYLAARFSDACLLQFYSDLLERHQLKDASLPDLPEGVVLRQRRSSEGMRYFLFNYKNQPQMIDLGSLELCDIFSATRLLGKYELKPYASHVCSS